MLKIKKISDTTIQVVENGKEYTLPNKFKASGVEGENFSIYSEVKCDKQHFYTSVESLTISVETEEKGFTKVKDAVQFFNENFNMGSENPTTQTDDTPVIGSATLYPDKFGIVEGGYGYLVEYPAIQNNDIVDVTPLNKSYNAWMAIEALPQGGIYLGNGFLIFTKFKPTNEIQISYTIQHGRTE